MSTDAAMAFQIVTPFIIVAGMAGNIIVCSLIIKNKKMRTSFNFLLLNLAASDLLCSILGALFYASEIRNHYFSDGKSNRGEIEGVACKVVTISIGLTTNSSVFTLAAISTDRFFAIVHPWKHKLATIKRKTRIVIAGIWLLVIVTSLPLALVMIKQPNEVPNSHFVGNCIAHLVNENSYKAAAFVDLIACYIIPMAIILRTSFAIIKHLWCESSCRGFAPDQLETNRALLKSRKRITRIVLSVIMAFNIFWLPWAILEGSFLIGAIHHIDEKTFVVGFTLVLSSASVNPILYSLQSPQFRRAVKKMFGF